MSNDKEIDAIAEYENQQEKTESSVERRNVGGGANKIIGGMIIILSIMGAGFGLIYKKIYSDKSPVQTISEIPAQLKSNFNRKFDVQPKEDESVASAAVVAETNNVANVDAPNDKPEEELDANGLTPAQAARSRRLQSGFGGVEGNNGDEATTSSGNGSNGSSSGTSDNALEASLSNVATVVVKPTARKSLDLMLTRGNSFQCALEREIDSTVSGQIVCHSIMDVYSSSGKVLLLERGTKVTGNYQGGIAQGQARIQATYDRLETPNGVFLSFRSPAMGSLGAAGIDGDIDTQFGKRFGNAILLSTVQDTIAAGTSHLANNNSNSTVSLSNTSQATTDIATETLKNSINIPAILRKNVGEIISVDIMQDIDFSSVYKVENEH